MSAVLGRSVDRLTAALKESEDFRKSGVVYSVVLRNALHELDLSGDEYLMADTIHKLSGTHSKIPGWCYASREYLGKSINATERTAYRIIKRLKEKNLVEAHPERSNLLRSTHKWVETVEVRKGGSTTPRDRHPDEVSG